MIKPFYAAGTLLLLITVAIGAHYLLTERGESCDRLNAVAGLTRVSSLSFGVAYYEPRVHGVELAANIAYPEMTPLDRMDFVYAK
ncbi:MAG: hypothetical protein U9R26_10945 [Campylobacterota bacterium]|nr:hypothetical protein [Campylobacterota bacterium]